MLWALVVQRCAAWCGFARVELETALQQWRCRAIYEPAHMILKGSLTKTVLDMFVRHAQILLTFVDIVPEWF